MLRLHLLGRTLAWCEHLLFQQLDESSSNPLLVLGLQNGAVPFILHPRAGAMTEGRTFPPPTPTHSGKFSQLSKPPFLWRDCFQPPEMLQDSVSRSTVYKL